MSNLIYNPIISNKIIFVVAIISVIIILLNKKRLITRVFIVILLVIINQRPMIGNGNLQERFNKLDVLLVIDTTTTMGQTDNGMSRLDNVINDCKKIISSFANANFAIISFNNTSNVRYPFTNNVKDLEKTLSKIKLMDASTKENSSLSVPSSDIKVLLNSSNDKEDHERILFFLSDGELTEKEVKNTDFNKYNSILNLLNNGLVIKYGNHDNKNLSNLADNLFIDFTTNNNLDKKLTSIKKDLNISNVYTNKELYYYFGYILLILLLNELLYYRRYY